jgi:hypothetical protein
LNTALPSIDVKPVLRAAVVFSFAFLAPMIAYAQSAPSHASGSAHPSSHRSSHASSFHPASHTPIAPPANVTAPAGALQAAARDSSAQRRFESRAKLALFSNGPLKGFLGPTIANPRGWSEWEWNDWEPWSPQPFYWGGSFWGPWMFGTISPTLQYGAISGVESNVSYPSYEVATDSPGAQLLADYGLEQTTCGAPQLVVIWGPNNSVACAHPDARVPAGNFEADPATLTIRAVVMP